MAAPKPIALTQIDSGAYTGPAPQPFVVVGEIPGTSPDLDAAVAALVEDEGSATYAAIAAAIAALTA